MSEKEREQVMQEMASYDGMAFEPAVGIFWFDPEKGELFDVRSIPVSAMTGMMTTIKVLHKDIWAKNYFRAKAKGQTDSIYFTDYTQIPRGRIFYSPSTKTFSVKVGHWVEDYKEVLTPLLQDEFNLPTVEYDIDSHWASEDFRGLTECQSVPREGSVVPYATEEKVTVGANTTSIWT